MAVTETPPETVAAASHTAPPAPRRAEATGFAAVLGSGDHKVVGRLYIATALLFGSVIVVLGGLFAFEAIKPTTLEVFSRNTVFQAFTFWRVGMLFLLALPLVVGLALVVVPLQVGARTVAFPRAAAASYWIWLMGAVLFVASYAVNGGPGGGRASGVNLWITAMGVLTVGILVAALCLATTVFALRTPGLSLDRVPLYAWSVAVASVLWLLTLPVLVGLLVAMYVDHRHGGSGIGANAGLYGRITWLFRNPQVYVVAIPVLGFAADVFATTARSRFAARLVAQGAIAAFGVLSFGAFLLTSDRGALRTPLVIAMALLALLPIVALLGASADLFRRGSFALNGGVLWAVAALLALLVGVLGGAVGSIPKEAAGSALDLGVGTAVILAAVIATLGGIHWWATKVLHQPVKEAPGRLAPLLLLVGTVLVAVPDMVSGLAGNDRERAADYTGGIKALNVVVLVGVLVVLLGLLAAAASILPALKAPSGQVATDPWEGQTLEWLTPSPPPLGNFDLDMPVVRSPEPLVDLREEK